MVNEQLFIFKVSAKLFSEEETKDRCRYEQRVGTFSLSCCQGIGVAGGLSSDNERSEFADVAGRNMIP